MTDLVVLEHLGALHPFEKVLTLVLAFGPFVVLALAVRHSRRRDRDDAPEGKDSPVAPEEHGHRGVGRDAG